MKVTLLAAASSIHTVQWANGLNSCGVDVSVISQHDIALDSFDRGVEVHILNNWGLFGYFLMVPKVKKLLNEIQPDLVNAHYASGYGTTARLVRKKPWLLSVWGSDVYAFPFKSFVHRMIVKNNLNAATRVASTSRCMADHVRAFLDDDIPIEITPFGVDTNKFSPQKTTCKNTDKIVLGTVKTLSHLYGIDVLIKAFALCVQELSEIDQAIANKLELRLTGGGEQIRELKQLVDDLNISEKVTFVGKLAHDEVPMELAKLDIYVALSRDESFGVAALEAGSMGLPSVVSDAPGLAEVVVDNVTGLIVAKNDPAAASKSLCKLIKDSELRAIIGSNAREHVLKNYSLQVCQKKMIDVYEAIVSASSSLDRKL